MFHTLYHFLFLCRSDEPVVAAVLRTGLSRREWSSTAASCVLSVLHRRLLPASICGSAASNPVPVSPSEPRLYTEFKLELRRVWPSSHPALPVDRVQSWQTIPEEQEVTILQPDQVTGTIRHDSFSCYSGFFFSLEKKSMVCKTMVVVNCVKCRWCGD